MNPRAFVAVLVIAGCGLRALGAQPGERGSQMFSSLYSRTTNFFPATALFKPLETRPASPFFGFAPLVLQEVGNARPILRFGTLVLSNGAVGVDTGRPALYAAVDSLAEPGGKRYPRFTYVWCYAAKGRLENEPAVDLQGVRLTLDSQSRPAVWEVLADSSGARLLFVSRAVETAAEAQYGKALEGRRFAIERSTTEAPNVIVARVLDDGPVPMGPIVYVMASSRDVSTVICRCMPAQARAVTEARDYEVLSFLEHEQGLIRVRERTNGKVAFWPGVEDERRELERLVRLPKTF